MQEGRQKIELTQQIFSVPNTTVLGVSRHVRENISEVNFFGFFAGETLSLGAYLANILNVFEFSF